MPDENAPPGTGDQQPVNAHALKLARRKKAWVLNPVSNSSHQISIASRAGDPLTSHGQHFGRTVHAMCNVQVLLTQGLECLASTEDVAEESLIYEYIPVFLLSILCADLLSTQGQEGTSSI
jgi:hypothetical protein